MIRKKQWHKHGDHPNVERYGESVIDQYPSYSYCGYISFDGVVLHVFPTNWIVETIVDGQVKDISVYQDGEH